MKIREEYSLRKVLKMKNSADELIFSNKMVDQINEGDWICKCPNCNFGYIHLQDNIEFIGRCNYCFIEFKLEQKG